MSVNADDVAHELFAPESSDAQSIDLQRCLLRLPQDQRIVLLLVSLEDLSYEEVARITRVPVGTVMSRLSRARSRLRELMDSPARPVTAAVAASAHAPALLRRLK
ncbi:MAG: sigma-70 family RNA polymerase sigma factor, partial [Polaromonas sp.]|nr:sigma-70 family RNA polymerase sigma factor [Polaromonas sp.]